MRLIAALLFLFVALPLYPITPAAAQPVPALASLAAAVAYAAEHNPQIAAGRAALRAAQAAVQVARAGLAPSVSVSASGSLGSSSPSASVSAGVSYLLYDGGLREAQIRQAEAGAQAAAEALAVVVADVALQTVQAYMAVITGDRLVVLREQAVTQARTQLAAAEANFRAGRVARADVVRAESSVATAEFDLVDARGQGESRRSALRTVMGLQPGASVEVSAPPDPPALEVSEADARQRALQRPEVRRAEAEVRAGEAGLAAAMITGGVTATVDGRYVLVSSSTSTPGSWSVGVGVTIPIFDGGRRAAAVEQSRANLDAAKARLESTRFQMQQEAVLARIQALSAIAKVEAARRAAAAARESLNAAQGRYAAGVGTIVEVTTAQTELTAAEVALAQALADRWTTTATLRRALALSVLP